MSDDLPPITLASASPRRRRLLSRIVASFEVRPVDVPETVEGPPDEAVVAIAREKGRAAAGAVEAGLVLTADTLVAIDGTPLGKPADEADALGMLERLSGRTHEVLTGVCWRDLETGREETGVARTTVRFRDLSEEERRAYVATGEPWDKAGSYAIQGRAGVFVESVVGDPWNVIGLPLGLVHRLLERFDVRPHLLWPGG